MTFRVLYPMGLRAAPSFDAERIALVLSTAPVEILEKLPDGEWARVNVVISGNTLTGFLALDALEKAPDQVVSQKINRARFMDQLVLAARQYETNYYYLGAIAWVESKIRNVVNPISGAAGPFQFLPSTWAGLVKKYGAATGIDEDDIREIDAQTTFAAIFARDGAKTLQDALERLPSGDELYCAHLLGAPAAASILAGDRTLAIDAALMAFYSGRDNTEDFVAKIIAGNTGLLAPSGAPASINGVLENIRTRLDQGLKKVAIALAQLHGGGDGRPQNESEPSWLSAAKTKLNVTEDQAPGASNPQIEAFHASTTFGKPHPDDVAWCASFVSWCMANAGDAAITAANIKSPVAADWLKWGQSVSTPPLGAVAVLKPLVPNSSGHVGFLTGLSDTTIRLLAGNQGNPQRVCEVEFPLRDVRDFRWFSVS